MHFPAKAYRSIVIRRRPCCAASAIVEFFANCLTTGVERDHGGLVVSGMGSDGRDDSHCAHARHDIASIIALLIVHDASIFNRPPLA